MVIGPSADVTIVLTDLTLLSPQLSVLRGRYGVAQVAHNADASVDRGLFVDVVYVLVLCMPSCGVLVSDQCTAITLVVTVFRQYQVIIITGRPVDNHMTSCLRDHEITS